MSRTTTRLAEDLGRLQRFAGYAVPASAWRTGAEHRWHHLHADEPLVGAELVENEREFVLEVDVPGVRREQLEVAVRGRRLTIAGHRPLPERTGSLSRTLRLAGEFGLDFVLPVGVDESAVHAELADGVLRVTLPKLEEPPRTAIHIR